MKTNLPNMKIQYDKNLQPGRFFIGLTLTLALLLAAFEWRTAYQISEAPPGNPTEDTFSDELPPVYRVPEPKTPVEASKPKKSPAAISTTSTIKIVYTPEPIAGKPVSTSEPGELTPLIPYTEPEIIERDLFIPVEQMPVFPGGDIELLKFLKNNVSYPKMSKELGITGIVIVEFIVDIDGTMKEIKIAKGVSSDIDKEALRVAGLMPKWNPGSQRNKPVQVGMRLPIRFTLM